MFECEEVFQIVLFKVLKAKTTLNAYFFINTAVCPISRRIISCVATSLKCLFVKKKLNIHIKDSSSLDSD